MLCSIFFMIFMELFLVQNMDKNLWRFNAQLPAHASCTISLSNTCVHLSILRCAGEMSGLLIVSVKHMSTVSFVLMRWCYLILFEPNKRLFTHLYPPKLLYICSEMLDYNGKQKYFSVQPRGGALIHILNGLLSVTLVCLC